MVVGLRARDRHLAAELDPGDGEDAAAVGGGERADVLLVVVHQGQLALTDVVHRDLQVSGLATVRPVVSLLTTVYLINCGLGWQIYYRLLLPENRPMQISAKKTGERSPLDVPTCRGSWTWCRCARSQTSASRRARRRRRKSEGGGTPGKEKPPNERIIDGDVKSKSTRLKVFPGSKVLCALF